MLRRCEQLGLSSEQVKKALIILCQEKVPSFKATLTNLMTQGVRTMLTHFLSQTSQAREEGLIYDKLKALKRTGGDPSMMTLITQLRICYLDFFNIKNPSENSMKSNLERAESLAYQNSLDFLTPVAVLRVKRNISEYTERNGLGPDRDTLINFLEAVEEIDTSSRTLEPITLRSSSIYLGQMNAKLIGDMEARDSERVFQDSRLNEIHLNFLSKGKTKGYINKVDNAKNQYNNFDKNKKEVLPMTIKIKEPTPEKVGKIKVKGKKAEKITEIEILQIKDLASFQDLPQIIILPIVEMYLLTDQENPLETDLVPVDIHQ